MLHLAQAPQEEEKEFECKKEDVSTKKSSYNSFPAGYVSLTVSNGVYTL